MALTVGPVTPAVGLPPITIVLNKASLTPQSSNPTGTRLRTATPTPGPTLTPTPSGSTEKIDKEDELKLVQAAYDALLKYLYKEPNTAQLLKAGLAELGFVTGLAPPTLDFGQNAETNWNLFKDGYNKMVDEALAKGLKYPKHQLAYRLVNAIAETVGDEHTYFLDNIGYENRQHLLQGDNSSTGFGVLVSIDEDKAYVMRVVAGSPADKAGLKAGDQLVRYDDVVINSRNWQSLRKSQTDEPHTFIINRLGQTELLTFSITKQRYVIPTVEYRLINGHVGYVAIREFFTDVAEEINNALLDLQKQGANSWVLDVRNNPGGVSVDQVVGRFVPGGEIMGYTLDRNQRDPLKVSNEGVPAEYKGQPFNPILPLVLLINEGSASSSEFLALAVHDFHLGMVIGEKSAGALGHTAAYPLGDGSAISVTIDEYESKGGAKLNGSGVPPDLEIELSIADLVAGRDTQLTAGIEQLEKSLAKK